MKKKVWILFSACLISGIFAIFSRNILRACGWSPDQDADYYSFFDAKLAGPTKYFPFFFTLDTYYNDSRVPGEFYDKSVETEVISNSVAWQNYLGGKSTEAEASALVYDSSPTELGLLLKLLDSPVESIPSKVKQNGAMQSLLANKNAAAIQYLLFAKACEPLVSYPEGWDGWEAPARDTIAMRKQIEQGDQLGRI